jgi:hypothetical protein
MPTHTTRQNNTVYVFKGSVLLQRAKGIGSGPVPFRSIE